MLSNPYHRRIFSTRKPSSARLLFLVKIVTWLKIDASRGFEPTTSCSKIQCEDHYTTAPSTPFKTFPYILFWKYSGTCRARLMGWCCSANIIYSTVWLFLTTQRRRLTDSDRQTDDKNEILTPNSSRSMVWSRSTENKSSESLFLGFSKEDLFYFL